VAVVVHFLLTMCVWTSSSGLPAEGGAEWAAPLSPRPRIELIGLSVAQREVVNYAVGLFAEAELSLPALVVHGSQDPSACDGHDGLHRPHDEVSEIFLCSPAADEWFRRVVLHELAHAWSTIGLPVERRHAFQMLRGWEHWSNHKHGEWRDNGTEQAAEIIAWGVADKAAPTVQIDHDTCSELRVGYITLTGIAPRHGLTTLCDPERSRMAMS
jgi:hypothetical protein